MVCHFMTREMKIHVLRKLSKVKIPDYALDNFLLA